MISGIIMLIAIVAVIFLSMMVTKESPYTKMFWYFIAFMIFMFSLTASIKMFEGFLMLSIFISITTFAFSK